MADKARTPSKPRAAATAAPTAAPAKVTSTEVRNQTAFVRGLHDAHGAYVELAPGEKRTVDLNAAERASAERTTYFTFDKAAEAAPEPVAPAPSPPAPTAPVAPPPPTDDLDKMSDADLLDTVAALTGNRPDDGTDRETLLALARGEQAE